MAEVNVDDLAFSVVISGVDDFKNSGVVTSIVLEYVGGVGVKLLSDDTNP